MRDTLARIEIHQMKGKTMARPKTDTTGTVLVSGRVSESVLNAARDKAYADDRTVKVGSIIEKALAEYASEAPEAETESKVTEKK